MKIPKPPNNELLYSERKELLGRITEYIGGVFRYMIDSAVPTWKPGEIAKKYGLQSSNVSMIKDFKKYQREISTNELTNLLMGDLVTIKKLSDACAKSEKEKIYLKEKFKLVRLKK